MALSLALTLAGERAEAAEPIRIGYLGPLSGDFAQAGKDMLDGLRLGWSRRATRPPGAGSS